MSDTGNPNPTPAPAPAPAPAATWYADAGLDAETTGYLQNRGWDKDVKQAALGAVKAHREAEKHLGVPADRLLRLPAQPGAPEWNDVWTKLGKPADATGYNLGEIKFKDGTPLDDGFKNFFTSKALASNLPKDVGVQLAKDFVEYMDSTEAVETAERTAKLQEQKANLQKNWGPNFARNEFDAKTAAARLGVQPQEVAALESVIGYDKIMDMFRRIGQSVSEDQWQSSETGGGRQTPGALTREQAISRKAELMADKAWGEKWMNGDAAAQREMLALNAVITGASQ